MSEGYLSKEREKQLAKILDAMIDFDELLGNQKMIFGVISIGNFLERKDRKLFELLIGVLDNKLIGKEPNQEVVAIIEQALGLLEAKNLKGFSEFVADVLSEKIETPFSQVEKQLFMAVLLMFNGMIEGIINKVIELGIEADNEQN